MHLLRLVAWLGSLALLALAGCFPARPIWIDGRDPRYPKTLFIKEVGTASSRQAANALATQKLRARLGVILLQATTIEPEVRETWSDGKTCFALAIVKRQAVVEKTMALREAERQTIGQALTNSDQDKNPGQALRKLLRALGAAARAEKLAESLVSLGSSGQKLDDRELREAFKSLLAGFRFYAASGNNASLRADQTKQVVLVLGADRSGRIPVPLVGLPVRCEPPGGPAVVEEVDAIGLTRFKVDLSSSAGNSVTVPCGLDGDRLMTAEGLAPDEPALQEVRSALNGLRTPFQLVVHDKQAQRIAVIIAETRLGVFRNQSFLLDHLRRTLAELGLDVLDFDEIDVKLPNNPTPATMAKVFEDKTDYLLYGAVETRLLKGAASVVIVEAQAQFVLLKPKTAAVLAEAKATAKGAGINGESASGRAIAAIGGQVLELVKPALK